MGSADGAGEVREARKDFHVEPMTPDDVRPAFAVVQAVRPSIAWEEWCEHVRGLCDGDQPDSGAVVLRGPSGYIYGLFTFAAQRTLGVGRTLQVHDFCVATLSSRADAANALISEAEALCRRLRCRAIALHFLDNELWNEPQPPYHTMSFKGSYVPIPPAVMKMVG